jgi:hypothetical protein
MEEERTMKTLEKFKLTLKYHNKLNSKLWNGTKIKPQISEKLKLIAKKWADYANIPNKAIVDIILVGGNANFNYTRFSDIDLHLVVNQKDIANCPDLLDDYLRDKKQLWSFTHNIKIYGHDVELYAQDVSAPYPKGQGVYSVKQNKWLVEPKKENVTFTKDAFLQRKIKDYMDQIDYLINNNADVEEFKKLKDKLRDMRSSAIQRGGEFSFENLIFKDLRNRGYFDKMNEYIRRSEDTRLSLK